MDPRHRFTATVAQYQRHRPDYPPGLFDWLDSQVRGRIAVDLGSGTGILTRMLAERGWDVTGVEPNAAMRASADNAGGARYVDGSAEALPLPDRSADLVIGAQAFHWFDLDRALPEIDRVGTELAVAVWNVRSPLGFAAAYEQVLLAFSSDYASVPKPGPTLDALRRSRPRGREVVFEHAQVLDRDGLLGRAWSSSYVVHGVDDRAGFDAALLAAFDAHQREGRVRLDYHTRAWAWPLTPSG
ncbi:MAG: methyltransferase domain-containing protein [Myxococcota bacterium]